MMKQQMILRFTRIVSYTVAILTILPYCLSAPQGASNETSTTTNSTIIVETIQPTGRCQELSSCKARSRRRDLDVGLDKYCYCDQKCQLYDDCCLDSPWTQTIGKRIQLGLGVIRERRSQWHCKRINNIFGDIVLRASCQPEWLKEQDDIEQANLIRRRCEYVKDRGKSRTTDDNQAAQLDPIGMMMPITDLISGVTYANSHCLRCNTLMGDESVKRRKLIYWSPLLECNYNIDSDERNTLYDLISSKKGQVLRYSNTRNKWIIAIDDGQPTNGTSTSTSAGNNKHHHHEHHQHQSLALDNNSEKNNNDDTQSRVCSIMPTIPDSVEHLIRYCKTNLIRSCPPIKMDLNNRDDEARKYLERAKLECEFGHQAITYSLTTSSAVYYNPACAICNHEKRIFCEPKSGRGFAGSLSKIIVNRPSVLFGPPSETEMIETTTLGAGGIDDDDNLLTNSAARANSHESSSSGSFSVLMDLYGSSQDEASADMILANLTHSSSSMMPDNNVNQQQCPDPQNQVFDPFYLTCRDIVCGLNHKFVEGKCVDKFKPAMVYITDVCLIISITSLALYLILYALSTFDLRPLAVELAQVESLSETVQEDSRESHLANEKQQQLNKLAGKSNKLYRKRHSRISNEGSTASGGGPTNSSSAGARHSQSLSTRGVASLAGSLLAAYLLFMLGHQTETGIQARRQPICAGLAAATYYCFLLSFCWMFLLAYDIWRTLRLATCQLRAPAMHSQSARYLSYALLAIMISAILVGLAVLVDQWPPSNGCDLSKLYENSIPRNGNQTGSCSNDSGLLAWWNRFVQVYRPNFGHQPGSCWFSNRRALALFFGLPVTLIMVANLIFFLHSSCMVIRTSSRSSRQLSSNKSSSILPTSTASSSQPKFMSLEKGLAHANSHINNSSATDFTLQNSLTTSSIVSVQTLQSHLSISSSSSSSATSSSAEDSSTTNIQPAVLGHLEPMTDGATKPDNPDPPSSAAPMVASPNAAIMRHAKLDPSLSSNSLATNHSCSSSHSIASSLAIKYDAHLQSLQSMMGSIVKDYRLYCRLSTIMGLTWLTGLLASLVDQSEALWYLFVVLNTLQGLFIFIAFGCKRSKLSNLELLFNYLRYRLSIKQGCCFWPTTPTTKSKEHNHSRQDSLSSSDSGG